jgi:acyl-CoA synthetase (AMP-forming)/AMP-acid ligase II
MPFEYLNDAKQTLASRNERGWTTLGDVGHLDADGYLYLTDRKDQQINIGGAKVYPQEVEDLLISHPGVKDAAVFGVPNEELGEEIKAFVFPLNAQGSGEQLVRDLFEYCEKRLSSIKRPRSIVIVDQLPRGPNGKLYKRLLKERALETPR